MTQDDGGSAPMLGSQKPVAWRAYDTDGSEAVYSLYEQARAAADEMNWSVEPLYRNPTLEDDEPCLCTFAARTVGDGCERCNPQMAIELLKEQVKELALTAEERGAIEWYAGYGKGDHAKTLRGLLERLG